VCGGVTGGHDPLCRAGLNMRQAQNKSCCCGLRGYNQPLALRMRGPCLSASMAVAAFTSSCDSICIACACLLGAAGMHGTCRPAAASRRLRKGNSVGFGRLFLPTDDSTGVVGSLPELLTRQLLKMSKKLPFVKVMFGNKMLEL
jgi:hypothetical protein